MITYPVPFWFKQLRNIFSSRNFHQFLFDGNIYDKFFWPTETENETGWKDYGEEGNLYSFKEFLIRALLRSFDIILYYSSTTGIMIYEKGDNIVIPKAVAENSTLPRGEDELKKLLDSSIKEIEQKEVPMSSIAVKDKIMENLIKLENFLKTRWKSAEGDVYAVTVIDNLDRVLSDNNMDIADRHIAERIQNWATDPHIKSTGNLSLLIAENRELLPQGFRTDSTGTFPIRISFPDSDYRKLFFNREKERGHQDSPLFKYLNESEDNTSAVIQITRGFRIIDCEHIKNICETDDSVKRFFLEKDNPSDAVEEFIKREKKDVIQSSSRGMLEPIESSIEFDDIGGLNGVKEYFRKVSEAILQKDVNPKLIEVIPKGVLLAGPPGTGKTLLAKALAKESGISLVKMGDIRSMWVGESEKNMSLVLGLLKEMSPVIVFVDEIDQAIGRRTTTSGDSGVSGRIFGKILEFMGDNENRGDVIWIAATNRADLLDDAMIRRFDRVIPVLLPGSKKEWQAVIRGIIKQMDAQANEDDIANFVDRNIEHLRKNHSGSSIEMVLRDAYQRSVLAGSDIVNLEHLEEAFFNFKSNFNQKVYELQTLLAISACNEVSFIPEPSEEYSYGDEVVNSIIRDSIETRSNMPLQERIGILKRELSLSAMDI